MRLHFIIQRSWWSRNWTINTTEADTEAPVVQKMDSAIDRINLYPVDSAIGFLNTYSLDRDPMDSSIVQLVSLILIHWIEMYPMDSAINFLNNLYLQFKNGFLYKGANKSDIRKF